MGDHACAASRVSVAGVCTGRAVEWRPGNTSVSSGAGPPFGADPAWHSGAVVTPTILPLAPWQHLLTV